MKQTASLLTLPALALVICACAGDSGPLDSYADDAVPVFDLREDWRVVSNDSSTQSALTTIAGLTVLPDGKVVTSYQSESVIRLHDSTGHFLRMIGRPGRGPGEFDLIGAVGHFGDTLWAIDGRVGLMRLLTLDGDEIFGLPIPPGGNYQVARLITPRAFYSWAEFRSGRGMLPDSVVLRLINLEGGDVVRLPLSHVPLRDVFTLQDGDRVRSFLQPVTPKVLSSIAPGGGSAAVIRPGELWRGPPGSLRVYRVTPDARIDSATVRLRPIAVPDGFAQHAVDSATAERPQLVRTYRDSLRVPEFYPAAREFLHGDDATLWIRTFTSDSERLVLTTSGEVLMRVRLPEGLQLRHASRMHVWGVLLDQYDVPTIVRYSLVPAG